MSDPRKLKSTAELLEEFAAIQKMGRESLYRQAAPEAAPTAWGRSIQGAFEPLRQGLNGMGNSVREGIYGILPEGLRPTQPSHINEKENKLLGGPPSVPFPGGRGDTRIADLTPEQQMLLKLLGGSGRINPITGLRAYDDWGDYNEGAQGYGSYDDTGPGPGDDNGDTGPAPGEVEANDNVVEAAPAPTGPDGSYVWNEPGPGPAPGAGVPGPAPYTVADLAPPKDNRTYEEFMMRSQDRDPSLNVVDWEGFQAGKDLKFDPPAVKPGFLSRTMFDMKKAANELEEWFFQGKPGVFGKNPAYLDIALTAIPGAKVISSLAQRGTQWEYNNKSKNEFGRAYKDLDQQERDLIDQEMNNLRAERDASLEEQLGMPNGDAVIPATWYEPLPRPKAMANSLIKPYQSGSFALPKAFSPNALTWRG